MENKFNELIFHTWKSRVWVCGDWHLWWTLASVVERRGNGLGLRFVFVVWFMVVVEVWVKVVVGSIILVVMG